MDAVKETIADVSSVSPSSAIVSSTASITLINTQLIHQFVSRRADAVNKILLEVALRCSLRKCMSCATQGRGKSIQQTYL